MPAALKGGERATLGLLPLGTGNSFVRHFAAAPGQSGSELTLEAIVTGRSRQCDVLRLSHSDGVLHFLSTLSLGLPTDVAALTNRVLKPLGLFGYTVAVVVELLRHRTIELRCELELAPGARAPVTDPSATPMLEVDRRALFLCLQNVVNVGGDMRMAPGADPSDGAFELATVDVIGRLQLLRAFPRIFSGTHTDHPAFDLQRGTRLRFVEPTTTDVMLDGEVLRLQPEIVDVQPEAISISI